MSESAFVWFHNNSENSAASIRFYESLFGWKASAGPAGMTMLARASQPIAAVGPKDGKAAGWLPYAQVDDVDAATKRAVELGAEVLQKKTRGPAGDFSIVRDPGGAAVALWQKA
ncbi:MAG: VOC family protein [Polyangiaceae bacterium]|nr:VOC family protein [Polyangiaceae bacterium]